MAALYVVARAVEKTGALQPLLASALYGTRTARDRLVRILLPVAGGSAFLNNRPIVAMIAPQVASWAHRSGQAPSRFLMPLSFAAILGGTVTAIGTSTNLVASGLMEAHGMAPMGMFELTVLGGTVAVVGVASPIVAGAHPLRGGSRSGIIAGRPDAARGRVPRRPPPRRGHGARPVRRSFSGAVA